VIEFLEGEVKRFQKPKEKKITGALSPRTKNPMVRGIIKKMRHENHLQTFASALNPHAVKGNKSKFFNSVLTELSKQMFKSEEFSEEDEDLDETESPKSRRISRFNSILTPDYANKDLSIHERLHLNSPFYSSTKAYTNKSRQCSC
jgi:hypothetical protein